MPDPAAPLPAGLTTEGLLARRWIAYFVDSILVILALLLLCLPAGVPEAHLLDNSFLPLKFCLSLILWVGYGGAFESSSWQATPGKRLARLRVYNSQGGRLAPLQAAARNLLKIGPFVAFAFLPAGTFLSLAWTLAQLLVMGRSPASQAIHDRIAQTRVASPRETASLHLA